MNPSLRKRQGYWWSESRIVETDRQGLLSTSLDQVQSGITIAATDLPHQPLIYVNDYFLQMTGYDPEEVLGKNCRFLQGNRRNEKTADKIRTALKDRQSIRVEIENLTKSGKAFWNQLYLSPIVTPVGMKGEYFIGIQTDISELVKLREVRVKAAHLEAVRASLTRSQHELNNALSIILGAVDFMEAKTAEDKESIAKIESACQRISDFNKKIQELETVSFEEYTDSTKMLKI